MRVILQVTSGPSEGRRIPLQDGEIARFGRSGNADVCFPGDSEMSDIHFELECQAGRCLIRDLRSSGGTLLNDQPVTSEADFHSGDVIAVGNTQMLAWIADESILDSEESQTASPPAAFDIAADSMTAAGICKLLELEDESQELLLNEHTPEMFVAMLIQHQRFADAIRVLAFYLSKRQAVWWAYRCVQDFLEAEPSSHETAPLVAALAWVKEPTEPHRRAAMAAAEAAEFQSAPSWVAAAAFWSDGSLAPPDLPEVAPDQRLTSQGVSAALLMTATQGDPTQSPAKYQQILKTGRYVLAGTLPLPT